MYIHLANRAAESDETYLMAVNNAQKLAEDVEKSLKIRPDSDVGTSSHPEGSHPEGSHSSIAKIKFRWQVTIRATIHMEMLLCLRLSVHSLGPLTMVKIHKEMSLSHSIQIPIMCLPILSEGPIPLGEPMSHVLNSTCFFFANWYI